MSVISIVQSWLTQVTFITNTLFCFLSLFVCLLCCFRFLLFCLLLIFFKIVFFFHLLMLYIIKQITWKCGTKWYLEKASWHKMVLTLDEREAYFLHFFVADLLRRQFEHLSMLFNVVTFCSNESAKCLHKFNSPTLS